MTAKLLGSYRYMIIFSSEEIFDLGSQERLIGISRDILTPEILGSDLDIANGSIAEADLRSFDVPMRIGLITGRDCRSIGHSEVAQHDHETAWILHLHMLVVQLEEVAVPV